MSCCNNWPCLLQHVAASVPVSDFDGYFYEKPGISLGFSENDIGLGLTNADLTEDQNQPETGDDCSQCCENIDHDLGRQCYECVCLPPTVSRVSAMKSLAGWWNKNFKQLSGSFVLIYSITGDLWYWYIQASKVSQSAFA